MSTRKLGDGEAQNLVYTPSSVPGVFFALLVHHNKQTRGEDCVHSDCSEERREVELNSPTFAQPGPQSIRGSFAQSTDSSLWPADAQWGT